MDTNFLDRGITGPNVPPITDDRLDQLISRIAPLVQRGGKFHRIVPPDPRGASFIWDPVLLDEVAFHPVAEIQTDHTCGHHAFFKPSIAEVLAALDASPRHRDLPVDAFLVDESRGFLVYASGRGHRAVVLLGHAGPVGG